MEITLVSGVNGNVTTISVQPTDTVNRLVQHAHSALSIPAQSQQLTHYGNALEPSTVISSTSLADGDLVMVQVKPSAPAPSMQSRATATLDMIRRDPNIMSTLRGVNPQLHQRIMNGDQSAVHDLLNMAPTMNPTNAPSPSQRLDPMSAQAQKAIEERIRQENIQDNMQAAMEHNPESFGSVIMLFVKCKINSQTDITAFVDSGAQATIISKACAERCNILRLLDTRFAGTAQGVGTAKIHGRIHMALLTLGGEIFEVSFIVMDAISSGYDMLLGLDMLRKHQACIDLKHNCLRIGSAEVPFLAEKDVPRHMRQNQPGQPSVQPPNITPTVSSVPSPTPPPNASASAGANAAAAPPQTADEGKVNRLTEMGFSRHEAVAALSSCNGDVEQAATILAQSKYGF